MAKNYIDKNTEHKGTVDEQSSGVKIQCTQCNIKVQVNTLEGAKAQFSKKHKQNLTYP